MLNMKVVEGGIVSAKKELFNLLQCCYKFYQIGQLAIMVNQLGSDYITNNLTSNVLVDTFSTAIIVTNYCSLKNVAFCSHVKFAAILLLVVTQNE